MMNSPSTASLRLHRVLKTSLYADDLDRTEAFSTSVLGLNCFANEASRHLFYKFADQTLLIFNPSKTAGEVETGPHGTRGAGHVAFAVATSELDGWNQRLESHGVEIVRHMLWPNGARSVFFRDPAQNGIELTSPVRWGMKEIAGIGTV